MMRRGIYRAASLNSANTGLMCSSVVTRSLLVLFCLSGCQKPAPPAVVPTTSQPEVEVTTKSVDQKTRALAAKQALFDQLSARLLAAMSSGGPAAAIEVCSKEASRIADEVGKEQNLKIGRTSFKLRNPENKAPDWAQHFVDERIAEPQFVELEDGQLGALLPIKLKPQCITCHGPTDQIDPDVLSALNRLYPEDNATGFHIDDLRGWFWIEVPKSTETQSNL